MWNFKKYFAINSRTKFSSLVILTVIAALLSANTVFAHDEDETSIKLHGDWVVTVTNPDGSIAQEVEFSNALVAPGFLVGYLVGPDNFLTDGVWVHTEDPLTPKPWHIEVIASGITTDINFVKACENQLITDNGLIPTHKTHATVSAVTSSSFTLTRNLTLGLDCLTGASYSISGVDTAHFGFIISGGAPVDGFHKVTAKTLAAPITGILADQVVTLKATISFQ